MDREIYSGKDLSDISGYYVSTWSSFHQPEKLLNVFLKEKTIHVTGSRAEGFKLDGESFIPVGKDYYRSKLGYVKFIEKEGKAYLSGNSSSSYVRTSWYEYRGWQAFVVVVFIGFSTIGFVLSSILLILSLKKRKSQNRLRTVLVALPGIVVFLLFSLLCGLLITSIQLDTMHLMTQLKVVSRAISIVGFLGVFSAVYVWRHAKNSALRFFYMGWSIAFILFVFWLSLVNLL